MARGKAVDRGLAELVLQMKERNPKLTTEQIGAVTNCDASTAGRIIKGGSWEGYCAIKDEKARKGREREAARKKQTVELFSAGEKIAEIEGQIEMDLKPAEEPKAEEQEETLGDMQTKMMRFQAAQVDKICMKLDRLNDTLSMILRAVRKE